MKKLFLLLALSANSFAQDALKIGIEGEYAPYNAVDAKGQLYGFDFDIANALCQELQRQCEFSQIAWDGLIPSLKSGKIDAIISSMTGSDERRQSVDFTEKYYNTPNQFLLKATEASKVGADWQAALKGKNIGVQRGTIHEKFINDHKDIFGNIQSYNTQDDANLDLATGRIDVTFADRVALLPFIGSNKDFAFAAPVITDKAYYGEGISIAIRKEDNALKEAFNKSIKAIRNNGKYKEINDKYFDFDIYGE